MITIKIDGSVVFIEGAENVVIDKAKKLKKATNLKSKNHKRVEPETVKNSTKQLEEKVVPYYKILGASLLDYAKRTFRQIGTTSVDDDEIMAVIDIMIEEHPAIKRYAKPLEIMEDIKAVMKGVQI